MRVHYEILNQKGTPAFYSDTYTNRPTYGFAGRVFISTDTGQIFEDTGSAWSLIADAGVGGGTLGSVCANGNSTSAGIIITAGGLSSNSITNTSLTAGSVLFAGTGGLESQSNATFFWDNTNKRLGIGNASPGAPLDIHATGTNAHFNGTGTNNAYLQFQNAGTNKWRIGNTYSAGANSFDIYNNSLSAKAISIDNASNAITVISTAEFQSTSGTGLDYGASITKGNTPSTVTASLVAIYSEATSNNIIFRDNTSKAKLLFDNSTQTYTFPAATGTLALTSQIPSISGTTNLLAKFTSTSAIGNSGVSDDGTTLIYSSSATERMRITSGGELCIATTTASWTDPNRGNITVGGATSAIYAMQVGGVARSYFFCNALDTLIDNASGTGTVTVLNGSGGVKLDRNATSWTSNSDERLKNINSIIENALDKILTLRAVNFTWKTDDTNSENLGLIAQDVEKVFPQVVNKSKLSKSINTDNDIDIEYLGVKYTELIPVLVKAIQEQQAQIEELNEKLVRNNIN